MNNNQNDSTHNPDEFLKKKSSFRLTLERFGAGGITSLIVTVIFINIFWLMPKQLPALKLLADLAVGLISLFLGGVGGLILGRIWNNKKAVIIGGVSIGVIVPMLLEKMAFMTGL